MSSPPSRPASPTISSSHSMPTRCAPRSPASAAWRREAPMEPNPANTSRLLDAHGFLDRVIAQLRVLQSPQKDTLVSVLQYLSDHIRTTRSEIGALRQGGDQPLFATTADELEEIVTETARAANNI